MMLINNVGQLLGHADQALSIFKNNGESLFARANQVINVTDKIEQRVDSVSSKIRSTVQSINDAFSKVTEGYRFSCEYSKKYFPSTIAKGTALLGAHGIAFSSISFLSSIRNFLPLNLVFSLWVATEFGKLISTYQEFQSFKETVQEHMKNKTLDLGKLQETIEDLPMKGSEIDLLKIFLNDNLREVFLQALPENLAEMELQEVAASIPKENNNCSQVNWSEQLTEAWEQRDIETLENAWDRIQGTQVATSFTKDISQTFEEAWARAPSQSTFKEIFEQVWIHNSNQKAFETVWGKIQEDSKDLIAEFEEAWESNNVVKIKNLKDKVENSKTTTFRSMLTRLAIKFRFKAEEEKVDREVKITTAITKEFMSKPRKNANIQSFIDTFLAKVMGYRSKDLSTYGFFYRAEKIQELVDIISPEQPDDTSLIKSRM